MSVCFVLCKDLFILVLKSLMHEKYKVDNYIYIKVCLIKYILSKLETCVIK